MRERIIDDVAILNLEGSLLGEPDTSELRERLHCLVNREIRKIVLDLRALKWINSAGLGSLIAGFTTVRSTGGHLRLAGIGPNVQNVLEITQLVTVFKQFETAERAVASFRPRSSASYARHEFSLAGETS